MKRIVFSSKSYTRLAILVLWAAVVPLFIFWPALSYAQDCGDPENHYLTNNWTIGQNLSGIAFSPNGDNWDVYCSNCGNTDPAYATLEADYWGTVHTDDTLYLYFGKNTTNNAMEVRGRIQLSSGDVITGSWTNDQGFPGTTVHVTVPEDYDGAQVQKLYIDVSTFRGPAFGESYTFYPADSYFYSSCPLNPGGINLCSLVENADFQAADGWLLDGTAVISAGTLALASGDIAAQNLTGLQSDKTYNAVISATTVAAPTSLKVVLGTQNQTLDITAPGWYTATLDTPTLGGPLIYGLQNDGDGTLTIDYTCVSLDTGEAGSQADCIAPVNGQFTSAAGWSWYREARWNEAARNAYLPFNPGDELAKSLIMSTSFYTMPVITDGYHLLLSFEAETAADQSAVIATTVDNGEDNAAGYFEVYPDIYTFELDLTTAMSGTTGSAVAFANAGVDPVTSFSAEDDIVLDNVCIFVADRGPRLPGPTSEPEPGAVPPISLNYNYGCSDAAGILASWGINMNLYHQIYGGTGTAGDGWFSSWWNWLMAGFWVMLEALLCFLLTALSWVIRVIEYGINNFLNVFSWIERQGRFFLVFISALWAWGLATAGNIMAWWLASLGNILAWLYQSGLNVLAFIGSLYNFGVENLNIILAIFFPLLSALSFFLAPLRLFPSLALAVWDLVWMLVAWIWANVFQTVNIPITFYYAFNDGVQTTAFSSLMSCADANFWCGLLAGVQMVNQTVGHTVLYPIVIVGIILATLAIFWRHIWALFSINIR
jgi:hypothetical protein